MKRRDRRIPGQTRRVCVSGKIAYATEYAATEALERIAARGRFRHHGQPVRAYHCGLCPWWHLTSRPAPVTVEVDA